MALPAGRRLNSWKEIAAYVSRDVRTLARWEKDRGLPVHRVPGSRGQVFAFSDEIDAWLLGQRSLSEDEPTAPAEPQPADVPDRDEPPPADVLPPRTIRRPVALAAVACVLLAALAAAAPRLWGRRPAVTGVHASGRDLVATAAGGAEAWRHTFDADLNLPVSELRSAIADIDGDGAAEVIAAVGRNVTWPSDDALYVFGKYGERRWLFRPGDTLVFGGGRFAPPWSTGPVHVDSVAGEARIIWLTHHHTWWPSMALWFDRHGTRKGRFIHPGWLTHAKALPDGRLLVAGVSNRHDADVLMVLDDRSWEGAGPDSDDPQYACLGCPPGRPAVYFVLPRPEYSTVSGVRREAGRIHLYDSSIELRVPLNLDPDPPEVIYEFTRDVRFLAARPSDSYWRWHRRLEGAKLVDHGADSCPDRAPAQARRWSRESGWSTAVAGTAARRETP